MFKKITRLSFIIGLFFTLVSIILLVGYFVSKQLASEINKYTGIIFLVFGVFMMLITKKKE